MDQTNAAAAAAPVVTPGQKLVRTLEATSAGRLQRYLKTTAAQQSKAKQNIPEPKPPGRNDLGNAPVQVHQLPADAVKAQVRPHANPQAHATTKHLPQNFLGITVCTP